MSVDYLKQRCHCPRVVREEYHLVVFLDGEIGVTEEDVVARFAGETFYGEYRVAGLALRGEDYARITPCGRLDFLDVEFFEHLLARSGLLGFCNVGGETADKFQEFLFLLLGALVLLSLLTECQLARLIPKTVIARKQCNLAVVDVNGVRAYGVEEVAVVRNDEHGLVEVGEVRFEPVDGVEVEVVGRLVEEEVVGVSKQRLCQEDTHFLLTRKFAHKFVMEVFLDAEAGEQSGCVRFGVPTVEFRKFCFEFAHALAVSVREVRLGV